MSKTMRWIVGIAAGLVVVCVVVAIGFLVFNRINGPVWAFGGRVAPRNVIPWDDMPIRPRWLPGGMSRYFFPFGSFFGGLVGLGFLFLIVLGIVALVLSLTGSRKPAAPIVSQEPSAAYPEQSDMTTPARPCPNCQRSVNEDWSYCPYCGTALTPPE